MSFKDLWSIRMKPSLDLRREEAEAEYERLVEGGVSEPGIMAAYSHYKAEVLSRGNDSYAKKLCDFLALLLPDYLARVNGSSPMASRLVIDTSSICPGAICSWDGKETTPIPFSEASRYVEAGLLIEGTFRESETLFNGYTYVKGKD